MGPCEKVIETFKTLSHEVMAEVVGNMLTNSCCDFCGHKKVRCSPPCNEVDYVPSSSTLFRVALGRQPFFGCCRTIWGIHTPSLGQLMMDLSRGLRTKWRLLPRVIAQKTTIMMHPFVAGELFITSPHWDIRWANVDWGFRVVEHFNFGHPEVWREDHWFNLGRIWFGDSMGHLNQLFLIIILVGSP